MTCQLYPCPGCPLGGPRVGSRGDPNSPIICIGESPGKQELREGAPFVGPSGELLDTVLAHVEHTLNGIVPYYINAMQCYPGKREDKDSEILDNATHICRHHVLAEIAKAPRRVILAMGNPAIRTITQNFGLKITQIRGQLFYSPEFPNTYIIPTVHPAFLMGGGAKATFQQFRRDVDYAASLLKGHPPKQPPQTRFEVARDLQDVLAYAALFQALPVGTPIGADTETTGLDAGEHTIICAGFAPTPELVYCVDTHLIPYIGALFQNHARFVWHNGMFDYGFLTAEDIVNARVDDDTMLMSYALDEIGGIHDLETVASDWLGSPNWKQALQPHLPIKPKKSRTKSKKQQLLHPEIIGKDRRSYYELAPRNILIDYMAKDIGNTRALYDVLRPRVARDRHSDLLYRRTLIPADSFLSRVSRNGLHVDSVRVEENAAQKTSEANVQAQIIMSAAQQTGSPDFTEKLINSPKQLQVLLFDHLKLRPPKNSRSTGKDILEKLPRHPVVVALEQYRSIHKGNSTFVIPVRYHRKRDGRVHPSIGLHKTRTGRLAANDPNTMNIPRDPQIRGQYVAPPRRHLVEVDLNQAELRILACLSKDPALLHIYNTAGMSLHDEVRANMYGYPKDWSPRDLLQYQNKFRVSLDSFRDEADPHAAMIKFLVGEQKMRAKNVNFGTVYGITKYGLADQCGCTAYEAQEMLDAWCKKFRTARDFIEQCFSAPRFKRNLLTPFGRRKRFGVVSAELVDAMARESANFPEQSGASDCNLHSAMELEDELSQSYNTLIINLIHDATLTETPDSPPVINAVAWRMIEVMERVPKDWGYTEVPFIADAKIGTRWGSLQEFKPTNPKPQLLRVAA